MKFGDSFFQRIENKTKVNKETIVSLAEKLQKGNLKDEKSIREVIQELSKITGKEVTEERENKIVDTILNDNVPDGVEDMF